ncbi:MAG: GerMN domain-containing protein [Acidimicrobiia bacterium]
MRPIRLAALVTLAVAVVGGCGVPDDAGPRRFEVGRFLTDTEEFDVARPESPAGSERVGVFFLRGTELAAVDRSVENESVMAAVTALLRGPTDAESQAGHRTFLLGVRLLGVSLEDGTATIDLTSPLSAANGYPTIVALAQLVYTATGLPGVEDVLIAQEGAIRAVPAANGESTAEPLTRRTYDGVSF